MSDTTTIRATYGSQRTPCDVFVHFDGRTHWYAVEGSVNVNGTAWASALFDGCDVEAIQGCDAFTAGQPIESEADLVAAVEE